MEEKRKHKRLELDVSLELERLDQDGITTLKYVHVDVTDISRSGLGFRTDRPLDVGTYYDAKVQIWTREIINTVIEIVRRAEENGRYRYGCEFIGLSDSEAQKIDIYQIFHDI